MTISPMLFDSADPQTIHEFIDDDDWLLQQKVDGMRCLIVLDPSTDAVFITRNGKHLDSAAAKLHFPLIREALSELHKNLTSTLYLDGELMTDTGHLVLFDIPPFSEDPRPLTKRLAHLRRLLNYYPHPKISMVRTAYTKKDKENLLRLVREIGGEGVIAKLIDSSYAPGQRVKHSLKLKFSQTADCIVVDLNRGESLKSKKGGMKNNYILGVYDGDWIVEIANVSGIGREPLSIGDVVEVEYLYVGAGGRLVQPRIVKSRPDKDPEDCRVDQLHFVSKVVLPNH